MAIVYLAHDRKHDRKVALKVLRPELAAALGPERFVQEIKTTASLQHPHILPLYDSGRISAAAEGPSESTAPKPAQGPTHSATEYLYYVMPFVDGETLRDKLNRERQLGVEEAVRIATEVADALDYAHRHGVIHRDIKPENVLLHEGRPLVSDFGIALAVSAASSGRLTETGLSLGTPEYMSPEQAGADKEITARSDLYSLGVVLYEMLAGHPPHTGSSVQQVILKILTEDTPAVTVERHTVPPHVAATVGTALEKLPADRFASGAAFASALNDPSFRHAASAGVATAGPRAGAPRTALVRSIPWAVAGVALVVAAVAVLNRPERRQRPVRANIVLHDLGDQTEFDLSADGLTIAYRGADGQLLVRALDALEPRPVPGAENAGSPRFSPDGRSIAYHDDGLWRISIDGGPAGHLTDSAQRFLDWGDDGFIYFTHADGHLARIAEGGGPVETLTDVDTLVEGLHSFPSALPGGRGVLFGIQRWPEFRDDIAVLDLETGEQRVLSRGRRAQYAASGHLVIHQAGGEIAAVPFDLDRLELRGVPTPMVAQTTGAFALSENGTLLYRSSTGRRGLVVVGRDGSERWLPGEIAEGGFPRVDPEGRRIALQLAGPSGIDIWVYDVRDSTLLRLTFEGDNIYPSWSPDAESVLYASAAAGAPGDAWSFYRRRADGSGERQRILAGVPSQVEIVQTPSGGYVFRVGDVARAQNTDIYVVEQDGAEPRAVAASSFNERAPAVSADGQWLAYVSNESGRNEVYVRSLRTRGARHLVSSGGGVEPIWSRDGTVLFYRSQTHLMAAGIRGRLSLAVDGREQLLPIDGYAVHESHAMYDVMPGNDAFLFVARPSPGDLVLVLDWFEELEAKAGG
jgi:serine/threonine-protein kinase